MNRLLCAAALGVALLSASLVRAADGDEPPSARAKRLFTEAMDAYDHGRLDAAIDKLREAQSLAANPQVIYNLAQVLDTAGRRPEALGAFETFLSSSHPALAQRDEAVRARVTILKASLAHLQVQLVPNEALLFVDDVQVAHAVWLDPGAHRVRVTADGHRPLELQATLVAGQAEELALSLPAEPSAPAKGAPASTVEASVPAATAASSSVPAPRSVPARALHNRGRAWGLALGGGAVALAGGALTAHFVAAGQQRRWRTENQRLDGFTAAQRDDAYWAARASNTDLSRSTRFLQGLELGLAVAAGVTGAAGVGIWLTSPSSTDSRSAGLSYAAVW